MQELATFLSAVNVAKMMSPEQAQMLVSDFIALYPDDSVAFVKLFFIKARNGEFGQLYGAIDQPTIMRWYSQFRKDTLERIPKLRKEPIRKALAQDTGEAVPMPDGFFERFCKRYNL